MNPVTQPELGHINRFPPAIDPQFAGKPGVKMLRILFSALSIIAPSFSAKLGLRMFLTPPRHSTPTREISIRSHAIKKIIPLNQNSLVSYAWGAGPTVVLAHSWGGRGTQLWPFVQPLVDAGYRVVTFDGPAHGNSTGKQTDMMEFALAIKTVAEAYSPLHAVIGHSFGAANTLLAIREFGLQPNMVATIGCFAHGIWVIDTFGALLNIPNHVIMKMRALLEQRYGDRLNWNSLSLIDLARHSGIPVMLAHDMDDKEVPYAHALAIQAGAPNTILKTTKGNGHRRILRDNDLVRDIVRFIQGSK